MGTTIHFSEKHMQRLMKGFEHKSLTDGLFNHEIDQEFSGVRTVHVKSIQTSPLQKYDRTKQFSTGSRYGESHEVGDDEQVFTMADDISLSLTIDKGTSSGLEVGDCVMDETGALVGILSEVGTNWATVLTLVDTDTSLGAQVFRTGDLGLAQGDFALMQENRLRLNLLPAGASLLGGDLVVTSGLGGYYPQGLVIGSVEKVQMDPSGSDSYAILTPAVDFAQLTEVFVIRSFDPGT